MSFDGLASSDSASMKSLLVVLFPVVAVISHRFLSCHLEFLPSMSAHRRHLVEWADALWGGEGGKLEHDLLTDAAAAAAAA